MLRIAFLAVFMALMAALAQGCNDTAFVVGSTDQPISEPPTVCDPFGGGTGPSYDNGIQAMLTYIPANSPAVKGTLTTASFAPNMPGVIVSPAQIILGQFNVPTRPFDEGFSVKNSNDKLQSTTGEDLIEYFSVRAQSNLRLAPMDPEGDYELALLSDDGSILQLSPTGADDGLATWVNNDGTHANQVACASKPLTMTQNSLYPIRLNYYQGPRVRIALMLLWRLKTSSTAAETECGVQRGDTYFFTPSQADPSVSNPTSAYTAMVARGWKPVPAQNFVLPNNQKNPCL